MTARHPYDCHVRLTAAEYAQLQRLAAVADRSLTAQVRFMLRDMLAGVPASQAAMAVTKEG